MITKPQWTVVRSAGAWLLVSAMGVGLAGCGTTDPQDVAEDSSPAPLLFKDPSTSGLRLDVYDIGGHLGISVGGPIGTEVESKSMQHAESLEELYLAIHPEAEVAPAELVTLSERLGPELAALPSTPELEVEPVTIEKSQSAFNSTVCKTFNEPGVKYVAKSCGWATPVNALQSDFYGAGGFLLAGDRTYAWNNNPYSATVYWADSSHGSTRWSFALPQYWWNWFSVYNESYSYVAYIVLPWPQFGELGLTQHRRVTIVR